MPKKPTKTQIENKIKELAPWFIAGCAIGAAISIYRHYDAKILLEVPRNAHQTMTNENLAIAYTTEIGDFILKAIPNS